MNVVEGDEPFQGIHQAGILTNSQRQTVLAAFDLTSDDRADLSALLKAWTGLGGELVSGASVTIPIYTAPGPGGGNEKNPVGTVYVASARQGRPTLVERHRFTGDRDTVRVAAVGAALAILLRQLA